MHDLPYWLPTLRRGPVNDQAGSRPTQASFGGASNDQTWRITGSSMTKLLRISVLSITCATTACTNIDTIQSLKNTTLHADAQTTFQQPNTCEYMHVKVNCSVYE
jgi:hypothetical protein